MLQKRIVCVVLVLAVILALLPSCSVKSETYTLKGQKLTLPQGHAAMDIAKNKDGFLLLSNDEVGNSFVTFLDAAYQLDGESVQVPVSAAVSFVLDGDDTYYFARTSGQGIQASYDLYKNDEEWMRLQVCEERIPHASMEVVDGTLYAAIPHSLQTGNVLVIGSNRIDMPPDGDVGERYSAVGFVKSKGGVQFVASVENYAYRDAAENLIAKENAYSKLFDVTAKTEGLPSEFAKLEAPATLCTSSDNYGYILSGTTLYRTNGKKLVALCDISADGFTGDTAFRRMIVTDKEEILLLTESGLYEYAPSKEKEHAGKKNLQLAVCKVAFPELVEKAIAGFNQRQSEYTVSMTVYEDVGKLNVAMLDGEVDLLVSADRILYQNYIRQGYLRDMEELCPALFMEGVLIENVVNAARENGKVYYLPRGFTVEFLSVEQDMLGKVEAFEDFSDFVTFAEEKDPAFFKTQTNSIWFQRAMSSAYEWIDGKSATAHFTDESFLAFLRSCELCAKDLDEVDANSSLIPKISYQTLSGGLLSFIYADELTELEAGRKPQKLFPLPSASYSGYGARTPFFLGAVNNKENQGGTKAFVDYYFTETRVGVEFAESYFLTIRQDEYDVIRNGTYQEVFLPDFVPGESPYMIPDWNPVTDAKTNSVIMAVDHFVDGYMGDVQNVMLEEASRYFVGEITAEEAAEYIQNRVSIYLAEQG